MKVFEIKHEDDSIEYVYAETLIGALVVYSDETNFALSEMVNSDIRHLPLNQCKGIYLETKEEFLDKFVKRQTQQQWIGY